MNQKELHCYYFQDKGRKVFDTAFEKTDIRVSWSAILLIGPIITQELGECIRMRPSFHFAQDFTRNLST
jgi:hypothetical protein